MKNVIGYTWWDQKHAMLVKGWPGFFSHPNIGNQAIDYEGQTGSCLPQGKILNTWWYVPDSKDSWIDVDWISIRRKCISGRHRFKGFCRHQELILIRYPYNQNETRHRGPFLLTVIK